MLASLISAAYCKMVFSCYVGVYLHGSVIFQGKISLRNAIQPTKKATGCEILLYVVLYVARIRYITHEKQVGYELVQRLR